jgi:hypothetical protein
MQDDRRRNRRFRAWLGAFEARSGSETNQGSLEVLGSRCMPQPLSRGVLPTIPAGAAEAGRRSFAAGYSACPKVAGFSQQHQRQVPCRLSIPGVELAGDRSCGQAEKALPH